MLVFKQNISIKKKVNFGTQRIVYIGIIKSNFSYILDVNMKSHLHYTILHCIFPS